MLEHHGARWGDKVRIIGISIDQTVEAVVKHVKDKKWEKVEHFHRAGSSASTDYGAKGVPHVVLVDTHGKIVFIGHPASRDLEKDIDALINGEVLKGEGTKASGGEAGEAEPEEGFSSMSLETVYKEMASFADTYKDLLAKEEVKSQSQALARDFVVLVAYSNFDPKTGGFVTKFENVNVLVGPSAAVNAVKPVVHAFMKGIGSHFTTVDRIQSM